MESDAPYTQGGESGQAQSYGNFGRGDQKYFDAYNKAVATYGVTSPQARAAVNDAIANGWSPSGISQVLTDQGVDTGHWPSGPIETGRRSATDRRSESRGDSDRRGS